MRARLIKVIKTGAVLLAAGCAYAVFYIKTGIGIPCVFNLITGLKCPGCGVTHMIINLLKLNFREAWHCNQALMVMLPLFVYLLGTNLYRYIKYGRKKEPKHETVIEIIMLAVLVLFGIVRNVINII